jgi:hypothetical protein
MKRLATVVGAGVLLLLASACANTQDSSKDNAGDTRPTETSAPARPEPGRTPPPGVKKLSAAQLDTTSLPRGFPAVVWTEDNGRTVGVVAREGGCGKASVENAETAEQVVVTTIQTTPKTPKMCTMDLRFPKLTTELKAPLGDRKVVLKHVERKS